MRINNNYNNDKKKTTTRTAKRGKDCRDYDFRGRGERLSNIIETLPLHIAFCSCVEAAYVWTRLFREVRSSSAVDCLQVIFLSLLGEGLSQKRSGRDENVCWGVRETTDHKKSTCAILVVTNSNLSFSRLKT